MCVYCIYIYIYIHTYILHNHVGHELLDQSTTYNTNRHNDTIVIMMVMTPGDSRLLMPF